jgi:hypothetical protein
MRWERIEEAIEVLEFRFRYFPQVFRWRGCCHRVEGVEECWTVSHPGWRGRVERHGFRLRCTDGTFEVYQDLIANTWHLGRVRFGQTAKGSVGQVAPRLTYALGGETCKDERHVGGIAVL